MPWEKSTKRDYLVPTAPFQLRLPAAMGGGVQARLNRALNEK